MRKAAYRTGLATYVKTRQIAASAALAQDIFGLPLGRQWISYPDTYRGQMVRARARQLGVYVCYLTSPRGPREEQAAAVRGRSDAKVELSMLHGVSCALMALIGLPDYPQHGMLWSGRGSLRPACTAPQAHGSSTTWRAGARAGAGVGNIAPAADPAPSLAVRAVNCVRVLHGWALSSFGAGRATYCGFVLHVLGARGKEETAPWLCT